MHQKKRDEMVDCAILNFWHSHSHGAVLTGYALQCLLSDMGYTSELVQTMSEVYTEETPESYEKKRSGNISERFEKGHLKTTERMYSKRNISCLNTRYRCFITGSDQVFRAEWVDDKYFLDFVKLKTPKIAVAASFGANQFFAYKVRTKKIAYLLNRFNGISVREESGVAICKTVAGKNATWIADPVFLIEKKYYTRLIHQVDGDRKLCCYYFLDADEDTDNAAELFAKENGYELISITSSTSIEDFLSYINTASCVITDSYHGLCFCMILNKPVYCYYNEERGGARFDSLVKMFGFPKAGFIHDHHVNLTGKQPVFEYEEINKKMEKIAKDGREWINRTLAKHPKVNICNVMYRYLIFRLYSLADLAKKVTKKKRV